MSNTSFIASQFFHGAESNSNCIVTLLAENFELHKSPNQAKGSLIVCRIQISYYHISFTGSIHYSLTNCFVSLLALNFLKSLDQARGSLTVRRISHSIKVFSRYRFRYSLISCVTLLADSFVFRKII